MSRRPEPFEPSDPLDHKSRRSKLRRYRARHGIPDRQEITDNPISCIIIGAAVFGIFILSGFFSVTFPALAGLTPLFWLIGFFGLLGRNELLAMVRNARRPDDRAERAHRHHEEKLMRTEQKLAEREFTIGADGELVFGEKKKDQSAASDD